MSVGKSNLIGVSGNKKPLPEDDYTFVDYIIGPKSTYINTYIKVSGDFGFEAKTNIKGSGAIFGSNPHSTVAQGEQRVWVNITNDGSTRVVYYGGHLGTFPTPDNEIIFRMNYLNDGIFMAGDTVFEDPGIRPSGPFEFCINNGGSRLIETLNAGGDYQHFYYKLSVGNSLVFDGKPAYEKNSGRVGLYDYVSEKFFSNAFPNGLNFIAGTSDTNKLYQLGVQPLPLPEQQKQQLIDLGVI